ncbi:MAG: tRNA (adenosine(37)-N6)-threonylcarbamoyltransferase complex ATPase subunit type 1 TsaE [Patescibacteria group bacterium]
MDIITKDAESTQRLGQKIGSTLKGGEIIALTGNLGAGKTTFVQGLAQGLGIMDRLTSPTFILMREYYGELNLYHLDMYRLENNFWEEIRNLGLTDLWGKAGNVVVIEWAEKIKEFLPESTIWIDFIQKEDERIITTDSFEL